MSDTDLGAGEQQTYWNQLVLVKVVACYVRRYRDEQAWWINRIGLFKAVVTSSTIGAWAIWKDYAFVWGVLLGAAQILDAAKEYIPQTKHRRSASEFVAAIENVFIDARFEWYGIFSGKCPPDEIMERCRKLAKLLNEIETKHFPEGLPSNPARQKLAEADAQAYFLSTYGVGGPDNG
ncbi:MAG TPA: hypothetical protein VK741_19685 [Acetobacteraceae bacterium]|nr:hypothetical protein [Acetobacteraceae bacterium]